MNHKQKYIYTFEFDINTCKFIEFSTLLNITKNNRFNFNRSPTPNHGFKPARLGEFEMHIKKDYISVKLEKINQSIDKPISKPIKFIMYSNEERYHANKCMFQKNVFKYLKKHGRILDTNLIKYLV